MINVRVNAPPFYGVAKKDGAFHWDPSGENGFGLSGRIVHNETRQVFAMKTIYPGGPRRFQPVKR